jgi:hemoglobin-like flavoprotein
MVKQHNMLTSSITLIINNVNKPQLVQEHLDGMISQHRIYGVLPDQIAYFDEALTQAILDIFGNNDPAIQAWFKVIHATTDYFKRNL